MEYLIKELEDAETGEKVPDAEMRLDIQGTFPLWVNGKRTDYCLCFGDFPALGLRAEEKSLDVTDIVDIENICLCADGRYRIEAQTEEKAVRYLNQRLFTGGFHCDMHVTQSFIDKYFGR